MGACISAGSSLTSVNENTRVWQCISFLIITEVMSKIFRLELGRGQIYRKSIYADTRQKMSARWAPESDPNTHLTTNHGTTQHPQRQPPEVTVTKISIKASPWRGIVPVSTLWNAGNRRNESHHRSTFRIHRYTALIAWVVASSTFEFQALDLTSRNRWIKKMTKNKLTLFVFLFL